MRSRVAWSCALLLVAWPGEGQRPPQAATESEIKAAFLFNFTKFVDWPQDVLDPAAANLTVCVLDDDPFGEVLAEVIRGKAVNHRALRFHRLTGPDDPALCQVLFVSAAKESRLRQTLAETPPPGVLLVGESEGFAGRAGIINFFRERNRVRFEINPGAAERARLKISSQLLRLARIVGDEPREGSP